MNCVKPVILYFLETVVTIQRENVDFVWKNDFWTENFSFTWQEVLTKNQINSTRLKSLQEQNNMFG